MRDFEDFQTHYLTKEKMKELLATSVNALKSRENVSDDTLKLICEYTALYSMFFLREYHEWLFSDADS